jgi:hypothetical protein
MDDGLCGEPAAFQAVFYNYKNLPTRGFVQLIFRCPLNQFDTVYEVLGAPKSSAEVWFGIVRVPKEGEIQEEGVVSHPFLAAYHNFKNIVSQKKMELIFEVPLDQFDLAHRVLGPPGESAESLFTIARLNSIAKPPPLPVAPLPVEKPKVSYWDRPRSERAAICCRDVIFQAWLVEHRRIKNATEEDATDYVHRVIGGSRSLLGKEGFEAGTEVWDKIDQAFAKHLRDIKPHH